MSKSENESWQEFSSALESDNLIKAEDVARHLETNWQIAEALLKVARKYASTKNQDEKAANLLGEATAYASEDQTSANPQDKVDASSVIKEIAETFALTGNFAEAERVSFLIKNDVRQKQSLENLKNIFEGKEGIFQKLK